MTDANNSLSQSESIDDKGAVRFESLGSATEPEMPLQTLSFFQIASSFDSSSLDIILIQDAKTAIPYIPPMESDVDCACE